MTRPEARPVPAEDAHAPGGSHRAGGRPPTGGRRPWSAKRKARFTRTVVVGSVVLLGGWFTGQALLDGEDASARPVAAMSTAAQPSATGAPSSGQQPTATAEGDEVDATSTGRYGRIDKAIPQEGTGTFTVLPVATSKAAATGRVVRYTVEIEGGLDAIDPASYAATVAKVLGDQRGWQAADKISLVPVSPAQAAAGTPVDIRVTLATPDTVDKECAPLKTRGSVSCWSGSRAVLNAMRWYAGAYTFGNDLSTYRIYQINHEVGHGLGHKHQGCSATGQPADIMVQQTKDLEGCTAWPWPTSA